MWGSSIGIASSSSESMRSSHELPLRDEAKIQTRRSSRPARLNLSFSSRSMRTTATKATPVGGRETRGEKASTADVRLARAREEETPVKLVIGIVRPEKANDVLEALYRAEVRGLSISRVQGHGGELDRVETYRGTTVKVGLSEKVRFEIAVSDSFVQPTIDALCDGARTGEVGDGKIFVVPLERAVRIRTGETDIGAVTPVGE